MSFRDLDEFFDSSLRLPIGGREYVIPSPDGETGLWVQRLMTMGQKAAAGKEVTEEQAQALNLDDDEERSMYERLLGPAMDDMVDDGVPWESIQLAGNTAMIWAGFGVEAAERFWNAGGRPEPQAPNREARRKTATQGAGRSTQRPASVSGTKRQRPRVIRGEVADTPGEKSSATGS